MSAEIIDIGRNAIICRPSQAHVFDVRSAHCKFHSSLCLFRFFETNSNASNCFHAICYQCTHTHNWFIRFIFVISSLRRCRRAKWSKVRWRLSVAPKNGQSPKITTLNSCQVSRLFWTFHLNSRISITFLF